MNASPPLPGHLLILGGTAEAGALVRAALVRFGETFRVTTALAGRTRRPGPLPGHVRIGGFGGAAGLAAYLREHDIDRLIDATHPFATQISAAARIACGAAAVPRLSLLRPSWRRHPLDRWIEVDTIEAAAALVGRVGRRAWLTVGAGSIAPFAAAIDVRFVVRMIDKPRERLPLRYYEIVLGRGPFNVAAERHLLQRHAIDVLVCKASGGAATEAKIVAARELSLPVVIVRRPPPEPGAAVDTVEAALDWLAGPHNASEAKRVS
jgi:precorrin-6A/cobalt-precorrin-6A reductase